MISILLGLVPSILSLVKQYQERKITEAELEAEIQKTLIGAQSDIYESAQKTLRVALTSEDSYVRRAWPTAFYTFLFIHVWFVIVQPFGYAFGQRFGFWFPVLETSDILLADNKYFLGIMLGVGVFLPAKNGPSIAGRTVGAIKGVVQKWNGPKGQ